ncbi:hypothetical protein QJQ45_014853, partial [Haematococcus lacustris]
SPASTTRPCRHLLHLPGLSILTRPATNPVTSPAVEQQPIIHSTDPKHAQATTGLGHRKPASEEQRERVAERGLQLLTDVVHHVQVRQVAWDCFEAGTEVGVRGQHGHATAALGRVRSPSPGRPRPQLSEQIPAAQ